MAKRWIFKGMDVEVTYTLPVPPGQTAVKERVLVANDVPPAAVAPMVQSIHMMMKDIQQGFLEADPYKGWAPFTYGTSVRPDYDVVEV